MRAFSIFSTPRGLADADRQRRRHMLARMGLAWLVMMQVMMFAFPGYLRSESMGADNLALLDSAIILMNWLSFVLTLPVVFYCAWPVWGGAVERMRQGQVSMDLPVALGIVIAFVPSAHSTIVGYGDVYFESVAMFIAFLLTARYLELCARQSIGNSPSHDAIETLRSRLSVQANRVAFWFVVIQLGLAFAAGFFWYVYQPDQALAVMVAMVVISCPCAMAMAVPTSVAAAHACLSVNSDTSAQQVDVLVRDTTAVSNQSLYGSVAWHLAVTPMAAVGWVAPWLAAITMLLSSLAVAANAWRLYRRHTRGDRSAWAGRMTQGQGA